MKYFFFVCIWICLGCGYVANIFALTNSNACFIEQNHMVVDAAGRKIIVEKPFQRIISIYGAHTENLFALGLDKEIIGVSKNEVYPQKALEKNVFSYHDDPEKFLAATPDLVLIRPMIDRGYAQLIKRLEEFGITVVSLQPGTVEEMFVYWNILGQLSGKNEKAIEMIDYFKSNARFLKSLTNELLNKKNVYFESIHKRMKTFSKESMAIYALEAAGGINIAKDAMPSRNTNIAIYGKEKILSHAEQIDIYLSQYGAMNRPTKEMIKNASGFNIIKAIQTDQVYFIDENIVSRPTLRLLNGIYEIGRILYPDIFTKEQMPGGCH
jgi:iron complex transport system substrate-binding protein